MDYNARLTRFQQLIGDSADVIFFPISADLHYLTGIPRDLPNFGAVLHPGAWIEGVWISPNYVPVLTLPRMTAKFGSHDDADMVEVRVFGDWDSPPAIVQEIFAKFNLPARPRIAIGDRALAETASGLHRLYPDAVFSSATTLLNPLRRVKSEDEIATMRRAGEITEAAFTAVIAQLKHGMTELDIVSEVDYQLRRHGSLGPSFATSLYNSGPNHPLIFGKRLETWPRTLEPPMSVLFDFGAVHDDYCYDFGRTAFFGEPTEEAQRVHALVMAAQAAGIAAMQVGHATTSDVDAAARQIITKAGYGEEFRHRLGHGIGLDVHEAPFLTAGDETPLEEGMLFTVEPSITQFESFSARVEDVVVARHGGGEPLTKGFQELIVI